MLLVGSSSVNRTLLRELVNIEFVLVDDFHTTVTLVSCIGNASQQIQEGTANIERSPHIFGFFRSLTFQYLMWENSKPLQVSSASTSLFY